MKILISTPAYQNNVHTQMVQSLLRALDSLKNENISFNWDTPSSSMLTFNRNQSVDRAMKDKYDWLLFWDADIEVDSPKFISEMIESGYRYNADVIGLPCPLKSNALVYNCAQEMNGKYENYMELPKTVEYVDAVGTGLLLIKTDVFYTLERPFFTFTDTYNDGRVGFWPEDWNFCEKVKEKGHQIIIDPRFKVYHWGQFKYGS